MSLNSSVDKSARGAAFVEFVLVFPVFIILLLGFFEFSRFLSARGAMNAGAHKALSLATVMQGLDNDDQQSPEFLSAEAQLKEVAQNIPKAAGVNFSGDATGVAIAEIPQITLPTRLPGEEMRTAMLRDPIKVEITGTYFPLFPLLPNMDLTGTAVGYREPKTILSQPVSTDCVGNVIGSSRFNTECPCEEPGMTWSQQLSACVCGNGLVADAASPGGCGCAEENEEVNPDTGQCECALTRADCPPGTWVNTSGDNCRCVCADRTKTFNPETGECECDARNLWFDQGDGTCECRPEAEDIPSGRNPNFIMRNDPVVGACGCGCPPTGHNICLTSGGDFVFGKCLCRCPRGTTLSDSGRCECPTDFNCGDNMRRTGIGCGCECLPGFVLNRGLCIEPGCVGCGGENPPACCRLE